MATMNTATPSSPPAPPQLPAADQRLVTAQAFRRFVERVSLCAGRWLTYWRVPNVDRDDVFQDALLRMYQQRNLYDPALGCWESWAFSYVGGVVRNYRSRKANRIKREDTTLDVLPDMASNAPSPEEDTEAAMMQALLDTCMANLDDDSQAILHASAEGIKVADIAVAFGLSVPGAYARINAARARLQSALDCEQRQKLALGVAVFPLSIDQLLASDTTTAHFSTETMRRLWETLDRAMAADMASGKLRDDGTEVERYMGSPDATPRTRCAARILHTPGPRALSGLTHVTAAAVGAIVTYALMAHDPTQNDTTPDGRAASSRLAHVGYRRDLAPTETAAPSAGASPELSADAGAAEQTDAGASVRAAGRDDTAEEQSLFDLGSTAFQSGYYENAIKVLREHANEYPRSPYSAGRERLFILALIHAGRKLEARQRIERLRQADPGSALLAEFDVAMSKNGP